MDEEEAAIFLALSIRESILGLWVLMLEKRYFALKPRALIWRRIRSCPSSISSMVLSMRINSQEAAAAPRGYTETSTICPRRSMIMSLT